MGRKIRALRRQHAQNVGILQRSFAKQSIQWVLSLRSRSHAKPRRDAWRRRVASGAWSYRLGERERKGTSKETVVTISQHVCYRRRCHPERGSGALKRGESPLAGSCSIWRASRGEFRRLADDSLSHSYVSESKTNSNWPPGLAQQRAAPLQ